MHDFRKPRISGRARRSSAWLTALTAPLLAATGLAGSALAAYPGTEGRIAFVRGGNIYSITPTGTGLRQLTSDGRDLGPRWSPDGKRLAYIDAGNLWIMNANGSGKQRLTATAPAATDGRPTWSPSGRYLAFVKTVRRAAVGYLTRFDTVTRTFATFTTNSPGKASAEPGTAPAWAYALNAASQPGYFMLYEGARADCPAGHHCLFALGMATESQISNGFLSSEDTTALPTVLTTPDWFPVTPRFGQDVLVAAESCAAGHCTHQGVMLQIGTPVILAGAYQAAYSPTGRHFAFVRDKSAGQPEIYTTINNPATAGNKAIALTAGTQPDWQP